MNKKNNQSRYWLVMMLGTMVLLLAVVFLYAPVTVDAQGATSLQLLQSDTSRVILEFQVANYSTQTRTAEGKSYTVVSVVGINSEGERGSPSLPTKGTMIGIPPGAQLSLSILADDKQIQVLALPVLPSPREKSVFDAQNLTERFSGVEYIPDSKVYATNQLYPADVARIRSIGDWRSQHYAVIEFHPLQYNPATRQLVFHKRIRVQITLSYPRGANAATLGTAVNEGGFDSVFRQNLINYDTAKNWRIPGSATKRTPAASVSPYSVGTWYKISVKADGIYQVMCSQLPLGINPTTLKIFKQAETKQLAIKVVGDWSVCDSNAYLEFFGQAPVSKYAHTNIYWLTYGGGFGLRMPTRTGSGVDPVNSISGTVRFEKNIRYNSTTPWVEDEDHWFTDSLSPSTNGSGYRQYTIPTPLRVSGDFSATLQATFAGVTLNTHHVQFSINGQPISSYDTWTGRLPYTATVLFPQSYLNVGSNTLRITNTHDLDPGDIFYINAMDLVYQQSFTAMTDTMRFRQVNPGSWQYQIDGFTNPNVELFDITDPFSVTQMTISPLSGSSVYMLQFGDTIATPHEYLALATTQRIIPANPVLDTPSTLHANRIADYIIIAYSGFQTSQLTNLKNVRTSQGLVTTIIDVQDVYDEFSDGLSEAGSIRDFLKYAYDNWQGSQSSARPSYVLLVGDGHLDPKEYCLAPSPCMPGASIPWITQPNTNFIPSYLRMVEVGVGRIGETSSDNRYVSFQDNDPTNPTTLPQMFIGRLPADSAADVDAMVTKILGNESLPVGGWRSTVSFVADNTYNSLGEVDAGGDFGYYSELVANDPQFMPGSLITNRIYYNPCTDTVQYPYCAYPFTTQSNSTVAHDLVISAIQNGSLIINYVGHGAEDKWADESLLLLSDLSSMTNTGGYPVFLEMTCITGKFDYLNFSSLSELYIRASGKGISASWASDGYGYAQGHDYLDRGFFDGIIGQSRRTLGELTTNGKSYLWTNSGGSHLDLIDTYLLFGDPAARLAIPFQYYLPFIRK